MVIHDEHVILGGAVLLSPVEEVEQCILVTHVNHIALAAVDVVVG